MPAAWGRNIPPPGIPQHPGHDFWTGDGLGCEFRALQGLGKGWEHLGRFFRKGGGLGLRV